MAAVALAPRVPMRKMLTCESPCFIPNDRGSEKWELIQGEWRCTEITRYGPVINYVITLSDGTLCPHASREVIFWRQGKATRLSEMLDPPVSLSFIQKAREAYQRAVEKKK